MSPALPAGPGVRLRSAPTYEPPYDQDAPSDWRATGGRQPMLPPAPGAAAPAAGCPPARVEVEEADAAQPDHRAPAGVGLPAGAPLRRPVAGGRGPVSASPGTTAAAVRFLNTCLEIFNGYRPVGHFRALAGPDAATAVGEAMGEAMGRLRRAARTARSPAGGTGRVALVKLRQVRTCEPRPGVAEIAAVVGVRSGPAAGDERCWALAFRLERQQTRWLCTSAQLL